MQKLWPETYLCTKVNANRDANDAEQLQYEFAVTGGEIVKQLTQVIVLTAATNHSQFLHKLIY